MRKLLVVVDGGGGNRGQDRQTVADLLARLDRSAGPRPPIPVAAAEPAAVRLSSPAPDSPSRDLLAARLEQMLASRRAAPVALERQQPPANAPAPIPKAQAVAEAEAEPQAPPVAPVAPVTAAARLAEVPKVVDQARSLMSLLSAPVGLLPQERALAVLFLARLVPKLPEADFQKLTDRVMMMHAPGAPLISALMARPDHELVAPLLERGKIEDETLVTLAHTAAVDRLCCVARRRPVSPVVADALITRGEAEPLRLLLANTAAQISYGGLARLVVTAGVFRDLQKPLSRRPELTADLGLALFWHADHGVRVHILKRFLTSSTQIERMLRLAGIGDQPPEGGRGRLMDLLVAETVTPDELAAGLAQILDLSRDLARRICADGAGEAMVLALRLVGLSLQDLAIALNRLAALGLVTSEAAGGRELPDLFAILSPAMARVALIYWDQRATST